VVDRRRVDRVAADRSLVGGEHSYGRRRHVGDQLVPGVPNGGDLREGTGGEPSRFAVEHDRRPLGRRLECQPVLGQRGCRPQLPPGLSGCGRASIAQPQESGPVAGRATGVDQMHQPVEIDRRDQPIEIVVVHTSGQG
jgi:hypothetical protein